MSAARYVASPPVRSNRFVCIIPGNTPAMPMAPLGATHKSAGFSFVAIQ